MMNRKIICISFTILLSIWPSCADDEELSTATLPLNEILRLYRETEKTGTPEKKGPPVNAVVSRMELSGQLLDNAADIEVNVRVVVLEDNEWSEVKLLHLDDHTVVSGLPDPGDILIMNRRNILTCLTDKKGVYDFSFSLLVTAITEDGDRAATVRLEENSQSLFRIRLDETHFALGGDRRLERTPDGFILYPDNNVYRLRWKLKKAASFARATASVTGTMPEKRPEIEPMVSRGHGSAVSTLEGRLILRLLYELHFTGEKSISFTLPEEYELEKVYINGIQRIFTIKSGTVLLEVLPGRSGGQAGSVELVLTRKQGNYLLSGSIHHRLPAPDWPVHEMFLTLHLPEVFDYTFRGGSLKSVREVPEANYTYRIPTPGKAMMFHQYLIQSSLPSVSIDYAIAIDGDYFIAPEY